MSPPEVPWSPFRGLSARERAAAVNLSPFEYPCRVCGGKIAKGGRMLRWRGQAKRPGAYNQGSVEGWMHVECPEPG